MVVIDHPINGTTQPAGLSTQLAGHANDAIDGLLVHAGAHTITLTATNSRGIHGTASITLHAQ